MAHSTPKPWRSPSGCSSASIARCKTTLPTAFVWSPPQRCATHATAAPFSTGYARPPVGSAEVISGLEEGRLIHLGIVSNARIAHQRALLIDLGGGSCELTISNSGHIGDMVSLPIGAVRLTQTFMHHDPPKKNELEQMRGLVRREISRIQKRIRDAKVQTVVATSGTPAALSGLYQAKADDEPSRTPCRTKAFPKF